MTKLELFDWKLEKKSFFAFQIIFTLCKGVISSTHINAWHKEYKFYYFWTIIDRDHKIFHHEKMMVGVTSKN